MQDTGLHRLLNCSSKHAGPERSCIHVVYIVTPAVLASSSCVPCTPGSHLPLCSQQSRAPLTQPYQRVRSSGYTASRKRGTSHETVAQACPHGALHAGSVALPFEAHQYEAFERGLAAAPAANHICMRPSRLPFHKQDMLLHMDCMGGPAHLLAIHKSGGLRISVTPRRVSTFGAQRSGRCILLRPRRLCRRILPAQYRPRVGPALDAQSPRVILVPRSICVELTSVFNVRPVRGRFHQY